MKIADMELGDVAVPHNRTGVAAITHAGAWFVQIAPGPGCGGATFYAKDPACARPLLSELDSVEWCRVLRLSKLDEAGVSAVAEARADPTLGFMRALEAERAVHADTLRELAATRQNAERERARFAETDQGAEVARLRLELAEAQRTIARITNRYAQDVEAVRQAERDALAERVVTNLRLAVLGLLKNKE